MKFLKCLAMVALIATTVFATSCKKDDSPTKPSLQGTWQSPTSGGMSIQFEAANYTYVRGVSNEVGTYESTLTNDPLINKLTINPSRSGAVKETYDIQWKNDSWTRFSIVATGSTPEGEGSKEGTYSKQ